MRARARIRFTCCALLGLVAAVVGLGCLCPSDVRDLPLRIEGAVEPSCFEREPRPPVLPIGSLVGPIEAGSYLRSTGTAFPPHGA